MNAVSIILKPSAVGNLEKINGFKKYNSSLIYCSPAQSPFKEKFIKIKDIY